MGFSTAHGALLETARTRDGDRVLISGASSSVGRVAIQVATQIGAIPIAVSRSAAGQEELLAAGAAAVVTDGEDLVRTVLRLTGDAGADVTLDLVRGPGQRALLAATRTGGTLVAAGFLDARPTPEPPDERVVVAGYRGFDHLGDPAVIGRMSAFLDEGIRHGSLRPAVDAPIDLDHVVDAHRRLEAGLNRGRKIVVTM
ncbi:zinc-binding dehydrogenase [Pseudonocardia sp. HH130629-09]|uniref:zinc-binding dehydrogenase n=1 Tax=Pseudonocardia sp. HH130629-09 TaxID=1641402 RepID=UPI000B12CEB5|nr:zinc-binding dehydrogenase [Pseudonocardia sp. HH130629-09]